MIENKQFEEWLINHCINTVGEGADDVSNFNNMDLSWTWGVYLEFFLENDIFIVDNTLSMDVLVYYNMKAEYLFTYPRQEAQQEAIKKAFEILEKI